MLDKSKGAAVALMATFLVACDSSDDVFVPLRVVHAVADAPAVDVNNGSLGLVSALGFKEVAYEPRFFGAAQFSVNANLPDGSQATVIGPTGLSVAEGTAVSVLAIGSVAGTNPVQPLIITNPNVPVTAGNTRVQVVHGAAGAPPVDIYVTGPMDVLAGAAPIAGGNTAFGAFSQPIEVPAGDYRIRVVVNGDTSLTPVFDSGTVPLPAGADLLVVAVDNTVAGRSAADAAPITLLVADGAGQFEIFDIDTPAEARIVHAVGDAPPVDVFVNNPMPAASAEADLDGLDFTEASPGANEYTAITPIDLPTINVLVTADDNLGVIAIPATDISLAAGEQYTVYASGTLAGGAIVPYITVDDDRPVATEARVRIIHLAPSAGEVDIYVTAAGTGVSGAPTLEDIPYEADTGYLSLEPGSYDVTVTLANTTTAAIGPATVTVDAGGVYTAVARDPDTFAPITPGADDFGLILLDDF